MFKSKKSIITYWAGIIALGFSALAVFILNSWM